MPNRNITLKRNNAGTTEELYPTTDWAQINNKPSTFAPTSHTHAISEVTNLQTSLNAKAPLASPALTGTPTAPTAAANTNTTQIATTAYVQGEITDLIGGAPGALDTLNELAAAINDDSSYASTITTALAAKAPLASPAFTGNVTMSGSLEIAGDLEVVGNTIGFVDNNFDARIQVSDSNPNGTGAVFDFYGDGASRNATISAEQFDGNAATTTKLLNARTIAGVSFDGTANISLNNNAITNGAGYITSAGNTQLSTEQVQDIVGSMVSGNTESNITVTYDDSGGKLNFSVSAGTNGADGADGADGTGFTGGSYNSSTGVVTFTSDDGLGFSTGDLRGADGSNGTNGTNGTNGSDGADGSGFTGGSYNSSTGVVTFTSNDGLGFSTGDLRGADGADGSDGTNGQDGADGSDANVTKANVEAVLTGTITSHNHNGTYAASSHSHGNLSSTGGWTGSPQTIASGDYIIIGDSSNSSKLALSSTQFGTSTTTFLRNDGTFATPSSGGGVTSIKNFSGPYVNTNGFTAKQLPLSKTLSTGNRIGLSVIVGTTSGYGTRTQQTVWLEVGTGAHGVLFGYYNNSTSTMRLYSAEVYINSSGNLYIDDAVAWTNGSFGHGGSSTSAIYVMDVLEYA